MAVDGVQERGPPELRVQLTECQQLSEASRGVLHSGISSCATDVKRCSRQIRC